MPSSSHAPVPSSSLWAGMPNSSTAGMPRPRLAGLADGLVDAEPVDAGHRTDRLAAVQAGLDEHRQHEILG